MLNLWPRSGAFAGLVGGAIMSVLVASSGLPFVPEIGWLSALSGPVWRLALAGTGLLLFMGTVALANRLPRRRRYSPIYLALAGALLMFVGNLPPLAAFRLPWLIGLHLMILGLVTVGIVALLDTERPNPRLAALTLLTGAAPLTAFIWDLRVEQTLGIILIALFGIGWMGLGAVMLLDQTIANP